MFLGAMHEGKCYNANVLAAVLIAVWLNKMKKKASKLLLNNEKNLMNVTGMRF